MEILETYYNTIINFQWQDYLLLILIDIIIGMLVFTLFDKQHYIVKRLYVGLIVGLTIGAVINTPVVLYFSLQPGEVIGYDVQLDDTITVNEFTKQYDIIEKKKDNIYEIRIRREQ